MTNNITKILKQRKKSQGWLALMTGIRRDYLNKIATGKVEPGIKKGILIGRVLKVHPDAIWPIEGGK